MPIDPPKEGGGPNPPFGEDYWQRILAVHWASGEVIPTDPYFGLVMLLCGFDGPDGSTAFVDEGPNHWPLYRSPGPIMDSAQKVFGPSSLLCNGAGSVNVTQGSSIFTNAFSLVTPGGVGVPWTFEVFVQFHSVPVDRAIFGNFFPPSEGYMLDYYFGSLAWFCYSAVGVSGAALSYPWTPALDTWYWLTISFNGTKARMRIDGVMVASAIGPQNGSAPVDFGIGCSGSTDFGRIFDGRIEEFRYTKGVDRYNTDDAVPVPTAPFPRDGTRSVSIPPWG